MNVASMNGAAQMDIYRLAVGKEGACMNEATTLTADRLKSLFRRYVDNDFEAAEPGYVYEQLTEMGVTREEADELGLGYIYDAGGCEDW
jgi:hypothetical protein